MAETLYGWLTSDRCWGDPFDRHLFACVFAACQGAPSQGLSRGTGLAPGALARLASRHFPHAKGWIEAEAGDPGPDELEEPDLRRLLLEHSTLGAEEEVWLAHIVARRSLGTNHLWQDLGLPERGDLTRLLRRHFFPLAALNGGDMKWKKFFYRTLCQREGVLICKSPNCESCEDYVDCFGPEDGAPLLPLFAENRA